MKLLADSCAALALHAFLIGAVVWMLGVELTVGALMTGAGVAMVAAIGLSVADAVRKSRKAREARQRVEPTP